VLRGTEKRSGGAARRTTCAVACCAARPRSRSTPQRACPFARSTISRQAPSLGHECSNLPAACLRMPPRRPHTPADLVVSKGYPLQEHFVTTEDGYILRVFRIKHGRRPRPGGGARPVAGGDVADGSEGPARGGAWGGEAGAGLAGGTTAGTSGSLDGDCSSGGADAGGATGGGWRGGREKRVRRPVVHLQHGLLGASSDWALNGPGYSLAFILADAGAGRQAHARGGAHLCSGQLCKATQAMRAARAARPHRKRRLPRPRTQASPAPARLHTAAPKAPPMPPPRALSLARL
jgi:hypothetical protein